MKLLLRPRLIALGIAILTTAWPASAFEGRVDMKMTTARNPEGMPITYYIKGPHLRSEITVPPGRHENQPEQMVVLMNMETREVTTLMPKQKMYMTHKLPEPAAQAERKESQETEFKPTGRKETIAGVEAEEFVGHSERRWTELWVTKDLGKVIMANQGKASGGRSHTMANAWQQFAEANNFFPLRVVQRAKEGGPEEMRMEVTKIDKSPVSDALFLPPSDYKEFQMPGMGDMMRGMMQNR